MVFTALLQFISVLVALVQHLIGRKGVDKGGWLSLRYISTHQRVPLGKLPGMHVAEPPCTTWFANIFVAKCFTKHFALSDDTVLPANTASRAAEESRHAPGIPDSPRDLREDRLNNPSRPHLKTERREQTPHEQRLVRTPEHCSQF